MKKIKLNPVLLLALVLGLTLNASAETPAPVMDPQMEAMMQKFQEYSTLNENHKALEVLVGSWDYRSQWWMKTNAKAEESVGTSEISWILNNHFLKQTVSGTSMGQIFEGIGLTGYNNLKKTYETIWIDTMATGMMVGTASFDSDKKVLSEQGNFSCPMVGGNRSYRTTTTITDADHFKSEMFMIDPETNQEFKIMELNYTRKK